MSRFDKIPTKVLLIAVFVLLSAIVFLTKAKHKPTTVEASWWNSSWGYRQAIDIGWTGTELTDFQVSFDIGTSALINASKMQTDCDDIRITDQSGNLLYHWIEEGNPGCNKPTDTKIWTNLSSIPNGGTTIYIYYGNSQASNTESGDDVFEFFDDFETGTLNSNKWDIIQEGSGTVTIDNSIRIGNYSAKVNMGTATIGKRAFLSSLTNLSLPFTVEQNMRRDHSPYGMAIGMDTGTTSSKVFNQTGQFGNHTFYADRNKKFTSVGGTGTYIGSDDTWYKFISNYQTNSQTTRVYSTSSSLLDTLNTSVGASITDSLFLSWRVDYGYWSNPDGYAQDRGILNIDNIFIRQYSSSDPITSSQSEESQHFSTQIGIGATNITPISSKLIAYYKFDEGYGTSANDSVGSNTGIFGTGSSAPIWTNSGKVGKALKYDGINDYISIPYSKNTTIRTETISTWIYRTGVGSTDSAGIINIMTMTQNPQTSINTNSLTQDMVSCSGSYNTSSISSGSTDLPINQWTHILCVFDYNGQDMNISLYKNGQYIIANSGAASTYLYSADYINIGVQKTAYKRFFNGIIDEVKIYNHALSADEVAQDYNQGSSVVFGKSSSNTGSTAVSGSDAQEYCVPGSTDPCSPPIGQWTFDKKNSTYAFDITGNGNHATLGIGNSAPVYSPGQYSYALNFNGKDYASITNDIDTLNNFTYQTWIKLPTTPTTLNSILNKELGNSLWPSVRLLIGTSGTVIFDFYKSSSVRQYVATTDTLPPNEWHFLSGTYNGSKLKIYINGQFNIEADASGTPNNINNDITIGAKENISTPIYSSMFTGLIDDVRIYNYARTPAQIAWDYNRGQPIAHWKLDENQGTTINDSMGTGYTGTFGAGSSAPSWTTGKISTALNFAGDGDYVNIGDNIVDQLSSLSISSWLFLNSASSGQAILGKWNSGTGYTTVLQVLSGGSIRFAVNGNSTTYAEDTLQTLSTGQWYFTTAVWNGNKNMNIYINGLDIGTSISYNNDPGTSLTNSSTSLAIGSNGDSGGVFNGLIDDVRIYNYALTSDQIKQIYNNGAVSFN